MRYSCRTSSPPYMHCCTHTPVQAKLTEAKQSSSTSNHTTVVMDDRQEGETKYVLQCSIYLNYLLLGTTIRPLTSVLSSLENAPTDSRLHNVKRAVNSVDRFRCCGVVNVQCMIFCTTRVISTTLLYCSLIQYSSGCVPEKVPSCQTVHTILHGAYYAFDTYSNMYLSSLCIHNYRCCSMCG